MNCRLQFILKARRRLAANETIQALVSALHIELCAAVAHRAYPAALGL